MYVGEGEENMQELDYEGVPFYCHRCHIYGHLVKIVPWLIMLRWMRKIFSRKMLVFQWISLFYWTNGFCPLGFIWTGLYNCDQFMDPMLLDSVMTTPQEHHDPGTSFSSSFLSSRVCNVYISLENIHGYTSLVSPWPLIPPSPILSFSHSKAPFPYQFLNVISHPLSAPLRTHIPFYWEITLPLITSTFTLMVDFINSLILDLVNFTLLAWNLRVGAKSIKLP